MDYAGRDQTRWSVRLFYGSTHRFNQPHAPNLFHRLMQRWLLGIVWERL